MENQLRIWHVPQVPMKPFFVHVSSIEDAKRILQILADYDLFQYENNIKPNYSNEQGLEVIQNGEWQEWYNDNGDDVAEAIRREETK